jgi:hypothetical protein
MASARRADEGTETEQAAQAAFEGWARDLAAHPRHQDPQARAGIIVAIRLEADFSGRRIPDWAR